MRLPSPLLVVTDRHGVERPLAETVRGILDGGARWVWFRDRDMEPAARHDLAASLLALVREAGGRLVVGGDADLAAAIGADGVHLSGSAEGSKEANPSVIASQQVRPSAGPMTGSAKQSSLSRRASRVPGLLRFARNDGSGGGHHPDEPEPASTALSIPERVAAACRVLGGDRLVGLSAHSLAECRAAARAGADYVTLSPIFATASKPGYGPALGLDALRAAADIGIPVLALGGIGPEEARACRSAGSTGVAVMGGLMRDPDPLARTRAFLDALG